MFYTATSTVTPNGNPRTLLQIQPPNGQRVKIHEAMVSLQGSTPASVPISFDWVVQASAGTASVLSGQKQDRGTDEAIQAKIWSDFTAEPTAGSIIAEISFHSQRTFPWRPPFPWLVKGGERLGLRYKSGVFVAVTITVSLEE